MVWILSSLCVKNVLCVGGQGEQGEKV